MSRELAKLKDKVTPFSIDRAGQIVEEELGRPINNVFLYFSDQPVAAASVAQVHLAVLNSGEEVAVKILRPDIETIIHEDIQLFKYLITTINFFKSNLKGFNLIGIVEELETSLLQELNLKLEAGNAEQFRKNMQDFSTVKIPKIYHELSTSKILVMERMYGTPIDNVKLLQQQGINLSSVAQHGLELLLIQIFRNRFFHADQHSGNVWIADDGSRIYLDFGIMGSLTKEDRDIAAQLMATLFLQDYKGFVEVQIQAGWVPTDVNLESLKKYYQSIGNMIVNKSQKDVALSTAFQRLLIVGEKFNIKVPVQFTLLVKTLVAIEGIAKTIDPTLNIQAAAKPIMIKHFSKWTKS
jgi:ubiquinone biosynthesis protein